MSLHPLGALPLTGIQALPSQPFGPLHVVPLVRAQPVGDLPLAPLALAYDPDGEQRDGLALVPHGAVTGFDGATPLVAYGTQVTSVRAGVERRLRTSPLSYPLGRRDAASRVRMMPMQLSLEGMLLSSFDARPEAWARRSQERVYDRSMRAERSAASIAESALRTFELDAHQCGMLLYAADTLLAAYVSPSPEVYAALHRALVGDLLGGTLQFHLTQHDAAERPFALELAGAAIRTFADLRTALSLSRRPWPTAVTALRDGIAPSALVVRASVRTQPFTLRRFTTGLTPGLGNGLGEAVHRDDGALAWLGYLRLSDAQTRRAYLLSELAAAGWSLAALAMRRGRGGYSATEQQLRNAGFEHVLTEMSPGASKGSPKRRR